MRLRVTAGVEREVRLGVNYQHRLTALAYHLLGTSDAEYARRLHDDGYGGEGGRRFKLFTFSWLRGSCRVVGPTIQFAPGALTWLLSSPVDEFVRHLATGLLADGALRVGEAAAFPIQSVEALPAPDWGTLAAAGPVRLTCLSPIVASIPQGDAPARYLTPADGSAFSEAVHRSLLRKHRLVYGHDPADDRFTLTFDPAYLARASGTKLIAYKDIAIRAAFAPFAVTGAPALLELGYEAGFGEKTAGGFGMAALASSRETQPDRVSS